MRSKFQEHVAAKLPFLEGKKLLLAVSGGIDSMVMVDLFISGGYSVALAHCNFSLRGDESDQDEAFVTEFAQNRNIPIFKQTFDTQAFASDRKISIQMAARELRYLWFEEISLKNNLEYILTAHHADDNLETFLINLTRGTGLDGLTGIPMQNGHVVRPLLPFSRTEIENYAAGHSLSWREDSSNAFNKYLRNSIRREVVPLLKNLNGQLLESFSKTTSHLQQAQSMLNDASNLVYKEVAIEKDDKTIFKIFDLKRLSNYRAYLHHWLAPFGFQAWEDIYNLVDAQSGKQVFSSEFVLLKDREVLILSRITNSSDETYTITEDLKSLTFPINISILTCDSIEGADDNCIFVDQNLLSFPLTLRKWREGDIFYPFGMKGKKTVSKYFKDEKFSLVDKAQKWILLSDNKIVWIVGHRMDDRFKVTSQTQHIVQIKTS